ncbi:MAG: hypothetical protein JNM72_20575 [Deltaproteobacteria bacterium]|nr:hypothetical protein [Deltaproteobacteria bacterium]
MGRRIAHTRVPGAHLGASHRPDQPWEARLWTATHEVDGKRVVVLGA